MAELEVENAHEQVLDDKFERIKLTKNSKGYNWEISLKTLFADDAFITRLSALDSSLRTKFGETNK
jgi:hypothetical protein